MARPKLDPAKRRTEQVNVPLSPAELAEVKARAEAMQTNVTAFLRASAIERQLTVKQYQTPDFETRHALIRIGTNLNQIAKALNAKREALPVSLVECCEKLDALLEQWLIHDPQNHPRQKL